MSSQRSKVSTDYYALINAAFDAQNWEEIPRALVAVALNSEVLDEDYALVLRCERAPSTDVRAVAIICLGHLARIHRRLPDDAAIAIIKAALEDPDSRISGQAHAAADDLEMFTPALGQHIRGRLLPNSLLWTPITWQKRAPRVWSTVFLGHVCELREKDHPDELPYTVSIGPEHVEFDELPAAWSVPLD